MSETDEKNGQRRRGFVALLDVLGFTSLISGEEAEGPLNTYQRILGDLLHNVKDSFVSAVAFSDSIVLTTDATTEDDFLTLALFCSDLFGSLLAAGIPVRGAISAGTYLRTNMEKSVFVAGRPIIEAHRYETKQNWVGIMLTPSAYKCINDLEKKIAIHSGLDNKKTRDIFASTMHWAASVQPATIPFHDAEREYSGFAIVPLAGLFAEGIGEASAIYGAVVTGLAALKRLQILAPDPDAQFKYEKASKWLDDIRDKWLKVSQEMEKNPQVDAENEYIRKDH